jgi:curved DNA-binding protein CbpA
MSSQKIQASSPARRRDPYKVLGVGKDADQQQIKAAYKKLALK